MNDMYSLDSAILFDHAKFKLTFLNRKFNTQCLSGKRKYIRLKKDTPVFITQLK